jgi:deoxyribodipyrimidine photo-lyase
MSHLRDICAVRGLDAVVAFSLVNGFLGATIRQFGWMLKGLEEVSVSLHELGIPFVLVRGDCGDTIPQLVEKGGFGQVVCDFSPLRIGRGWRDTVSAKSGVAVHEVDARNVVPAWQATTKIEYGARTIRPRIHRLLGEYLTDFPALTPNTVALPGGVEALQSLAASISNAEQSDADPLPPPAEAAASSSSSLAASSASSSATAVAGGASAAAVFGVGKTIDWAGALAALEVDRTVPEVAWLRPGQSAGLEQVQRFLGRIKRYATERNDPTKDATSVISPYLHFGNLSSQRAALLARAVRSAAPASVDGFIEEMIVRRELAENYVLFNPDGYDRLDGLYPQYDNDSWAQKSLRIHAGDKRGVLYSQEQLEAGETHDAFWNAAQAEMVHHGHMPGFNRMYWAKSELPACEHIACERLVAPADTSAFVCCFGAIAALAEILEWTPSPEEALRIAIYLNDKYELDGRDPNGYVGCAWAIGGLHDQGWKEREVFGKIRYMNLAGAMRKFDVNGYIARVARQVETETGIKSSLAQGTTPKTSAIGRNGQLYGLAGKRA